MVRISLLLRLFAPTFCALLVAISPATAEEMSEWSTSGNWTILIDPTAGNGCLMQTVLEDGEQLRIGLVPERKGGFISVASSDWPEFETDTSGTVKLFFEDAKFGGEATYLSIDGQNIGYAFFDNPSFALDVARKQKVRILFSNGYEVSLQLAGSARAADAVNQCQEQQP